MKNKQEYRIEEYLGRFTIQTKAYEIIVKKSGPFWNRKKKKRQREYWTEVTKHGYPYTYFKGMMCSDQISSFKTLKKAMDRVDLFRKGTIYHTIIIN